MNPRVVVISAFGRGNWLAAECSSLGLESQLVDLTEGLGRWAPEDWEGPFGYLQSESLSQSQKMRLDEEDYSESIEDGLVIWLKSGPLDLRGSHSQYLFEKREISHLVSEYVANYGQLTAKNRGEARKQIEALPFRDNWFAAFAHAYASPVAAEHVENLKYGEPSPLFSPYFVRRVSRRGAEKSLNWVETQGVKIYQKAKLKDISYSGKSVSSIEIESDWSGVINADQFIFCLSSLELQRLNPKVGQMLFPSGAIKPEWVWLRYRIQMQAPEIASGLPLKFVVIEDLALPWYHENYQLIQKTTSQDAFDVWVKIPNSLRFQKTYIEEIGRKITEILASRVPTSNPVIVDMPQDYVYDEAILGPARFAQLTPESKAKLKRLNCSNFHFDGPELWNSLDWNGQFQHQSELFANVKAWKLEYDRKLEKLQARERSRAHDETKNEGER